MTIIFECCHDQQDHQWCGIATRIL